MIKSTFSRNSTKVPSSCSSKKLSLASLAQKLQDVDLSSTSSLPDDELKKPLTPFCVTNDGESSGKLTAFIRSDEDHCSDIGKSIEENVVRVEGVFSCTSQTVPMFGNVCSATAACFYKPDKNDAVAELCSASIQKRSGTSLADVSGNQNDCSFEIRQLHVNPPQKRCRLAKPTPFGLTLSAVPNTSVRAVRRHQNDLMLYTRFSYSRQTAAVAQKHRQLYNANSQTIIPFDFSTPSPDDIVRQKQEMAFGSSAN